ncbi:type IV secretory system conjugative DNA transfer family protein [Propionibacterium freudenreichii]|uniref:type IV secretory system conjugative DNA transfer family protein n=1 Tax=Propionibacterium freudenreichii TaxID=1744 RepID=UPI00049EF5DF|nr:type IV secretory system conjugative DNA transfer family protein [Propionibacterium freudenreichii]MDK9301849.1 type IV secretory system conjugative DNA transfer family protein [Propionibacterium freudenreichii]MDK9319377.1 type IV secretory system conjugative DNA transfer family protein [Propionibacterium freudenreichii]MDK9339762.1 type IV secretory system conjugative DNA transfer family protein [Propionibacterium freudenreichii]MDK9352047.1 type IV secretory system conjugative DNA transfe
MNRDGTDTSSWTALAAIGITVGVLACWHVSAVATLGGHWGDPLTSMAVLVGAIAGTRQVPTPSWVVFALMVAAATVVIVLARMRWRRAYPASQSALDRQRGHSARWASKKDLADLIDAGPGKRFMVGTLSGRRVWTEVGRSKLVLAPSGQGKTPRIVVPDVLLHTGPAVVVSVKSDVMALTQAQRRRVGKTMVFNPAHPTTSVRWSPLEMVTDWSSALRAASYFTSTASANKDQQQFWVQNAEDFMAPLLLAAALSDGTMKEVSQWVYTITESSAEIIQILTSHGFDDARARLSALLGTVAETRDGVLTTARTIMKAWNHPDVAACVSVRSGETGDNVLHIPDLIHSTDTLYLVSAASEQKLFAPIFETLVNAVYREVELAYEANNGHPINPRLALVIDEAANVAPVRRLAEIASAGAGQGVLLETVWQDEGQIIDSYGRDTARTIMSNHWATLYLSGISDTQTLTNLSRRIGQDSFVRYSVSNDMTGRRNTSTNVVEEDVAPASSLASVGRGKAIVVMADRKPARMDEPGWFEDKQLRAMVDPSVAAVFDQEYTNG